MAKIQEDPSMAKVRSLFENSGKTLDQLGQDMGYPPETARQSAWQFMKTDNPRIDMLRRFAKAMGITIEKLVAEGKRR